MPIHCHARSATMHTSCACSKHKLGKKTFASWVLPHAVFPWYPSHTACCWLCSSSSPPVCTTQGNDWLLLGQNQAMLQAAEHVFSNRDMVEGKFSENISGIEQRTGTKSKKYTLKEKGGTKGETVWKFFSYLPWNYNVSDQVFNMAPSSKSTAARRNESGRDMCKCSFSQNWKSSSSWNELRGQRERQTSSAQSCLGEKPRTRLKLWNVCTCWTLEEITTHWWMS